MNLDGYTLQPDGTYAKTVTFVWGFDKKEQRTETMVRNAAGNLIRVEGRAPRKSTVTPERLPYKPRAKKNPPRPKP
jgi:hypothetical protein